jgi:hypothetical protein
MGLQKWLRVGWLLMATGGGSLPVPAEQLLPLGIDELARHADAVIHGTVIETACQRDPAGRIYTAVRLYVVDVWKGRVTASPIRLVHSGGVLGERRSAGSFQPVFRVGEEVVVFVSWNRRGEAVCVGLAQGKFQVWQDSVTHEPVAANLFHGRVPESAPAAIQLREERAGLRTRSIPSRRARETRTPAALSAPNAPLTLRQLRARVEEVPR